ncbi:MAG: hypothetical protein LRY75_02800 [Shewanella xiamenensis]|uniref:hypothetical protein n=1 Tax=Shewanella sp. Sh95 TaxID=1689868 RepID=UPI0006DB3226|nr:hypothetical protein [Shewanella sp. Sh95]KPN77639.1 hypothetical protein AEA42_07385 [Shewanella sp. Sh95]MCD8551902.1 hypothetical protein [Shewanella xiamenensis]MCD8557756.1 hypothetical protein [Shewanella xiamenensis]
MPKKLSVLCRVEPGCLGPDGREHIEAFCTLAQQAMKHFAVDLVTWTLVPRYDKTMPEMEYTVDHKNLSRSQVSQYFNTLGQDLDAFEEVFNDKLTAFINLYLARKS